jgi:iron complex outermembrane receptor protein
VRGTYATAFRAPSVADLFGGRTEHTPVVEDPCDTRPPSAGDGSRTLDAMVQVQCAAQGVPMDSTVSISVVYEPPEVKGLAVTADYWHVGIDNAIETLGVPTIFANCYDRGIQSFCDQIHRDPVTHRITSVDELLQNVTRTVTSGVDLAVWYDAWYPSIGRLHGGLEAQYLLRYDLDTPLQVIHGVGYYDLGVYPRYKANLSSSWSQPGGASGGFVLRYVGGYQECAGDDCNRPQNPASASREVDRYMKLDLFASYDFQLGIGKTTLQLGMNNAFDATPPAVYHAPAANSDPATYDFVGRMVYVRLSQRF